MDVILFYAFAALTLGGAAATVWLRNAVHSAVALATSLLGVAGLYLLQQAEFLFAVQIVLYIGGILVLFLFVIMLVNLEEAARQSRFARTWPLSVICTLGVGGVLAFSIGRSGVPARSEGAVSALAGNTEQIGDVMLSQYLAPFELLSVLLLVAVVGSVMMAKRRI